MDWIECPNCGHKNKSMYKYCAICFSKLHADKVSSRREINLHKVAKINKVLFIIIALLIAIILYKTGFIKF
ncbi:MAG: hypothetical protein ACK4JE_02215 [Endomicrobiia bacterium]